MILFLVASRVARIASSITLRTIKDFVDNLKDRIQDTKDTQKIPNYEQLVKEELGDVLDKDDIKGIIDHLDATADMIPGAYWGVDPETLDKLKNHYMDTGSDVHFLWVNLRDMENSDPDYFNKKKAEKDVHELSSIIHRNPGYIQYAPDAPDWVQLIAVERSGDLLKYIEDPSEVVQKAALKNDIKAIRYINLPSISIQKFVVELDKRNIKFLKNPAELVQMMAVKEDPEIFKYIKNPTEKVRKYVGSLLIS